MKEEEGYNCFWKYLGCTLMIIAGLVIVWIISIILTLILK